MNTITMEKKYQLPTYTKLPLVVTKGQGAYIWDQTGRKYLDFYGGHAVALIGHCHPAIIKAVSGQLKRLIFYSNIVYNEQRALAAKQLVTIAGKSFSNVFFCNSGTEANETAIKLAKKYTGKDEIISFYGSFHGRTLGSLSVTGDNKYKKNAGSLIPNIKFAKFGDIESVAKLISNKTAAVILEPIQSIAGVNIAIPSFYKQLEKLTKDRRIVLIFDEIQTGLGRTGKIFFSELVGVTPDIITLAKGIAGGLPAGAVLVNKDLVKSVQIDDQGSTFGGGPVICSAISATITVIQKNNLTENAAKMGIELKKRISTLKHALSVTGEGLLLGINLDIPASKIQKKLLEKGIITGTSSNKSVLRIMPPITITQGEVAIFIRQLKQVLEAISDE